MAAMVREAAAGVARVDGGGDLREDVRAAHAGAQHARRLVEDLADRDPHARRLVVLADDERPRRVAPVAVVTHRDVGDHHVAVDGLLRPGHRDRPAHERRAIADQEVGPEVGDRTRRDVGRGLRRGIQLDLPRTGERRLPRPRPARGARARTRARCAAAPRRP